jgi:hypothetical protein
VNEHKQPTKAGSLSASLARESLFSDARRVAAPRCQSLGRSLARCYWQVENTWLDAGRYPHFRSCSRRSPGFGSRALTCIGHEMSASLAVKVYESSLPEKLKILAARLALFGDEHGRRIFPSIERLARECSCSAREVQRRMKRLREMGILSPEGGMAGGRGRTVRYVLNVAALPSCGTARKDDGVSSPFSAGSTVPKGIAGFVRMQSAESGFARPRGHGCDGTVNLATLPNTRSRGFSGFGN